MSLRYYKIGIFFFVIIILSLIIDLAIKEWIVPLMNQITQKDILRFPSYAAIMCFIIYIYNSYLWKIPIINFLIKVPNFNGRYRVELKFDYKNKDGNNVIKKCIVEIQQTASTI